MTTVIRFLINVSVVIWCFASTSGVNAAHSRRRSTSVPAKRLDAHYDRVITTFSKDGRLLQVEYGMQASKRGGPVAAFKTPNDDAILLAVSSPRNGGAIASSDKVHRIGEHIFMAISGLSGDGRFIAQHLRYFCQRHKLEYGEAPTVEEVAKEAADVQHFSTRRAGARPLGCTTIIFGADSTPSRKIGKKRLFRTDPGGIVEECVFAAAGRNEDDMLDELDKLHGKTKDELDSSGAKQRVSLWAQFVRAVLKKTTTEHTHEGNDQQDQSERDIGVDEGIDFWVMTTRAETDELLVRRVEAITERNLMVKLSPL